MDRLHTDDGDAKPEAAVSRSRPFLMVATTTEQAFVPTICLRTGDDGDDGDDDGGENDYGGTEKHRMVITMIAMFMVMDSMMMMMMTMKVMGMVMVTKPKHENMLIVITAEAVGADKQVRSGNHTLRTTHMLLMIKR